MPPTLTVSTPPSERLLRAAAIFGLAVRHAPREPRPLPAGAAEALDAALFPGEVALITGPSGSGKSSLLEALERLLRAAGRDTRTLPEPPPDTTVIDALEGPLADALSSLASAGLSEAALTSRTPRELSQGERFRLRLALALHTLTRERPTRPVTFVCDEFASLLDRTTARALAKTLRRWLRRAADAGLTVRLILATAHTDLTPWLDPEVTVTTDFPTTAAVQRITAAPR